MKKISLIIAFFFNFLNCFADDSRVVHKYADDLYFVAQKITEDSPLLTDETDEDLLKTTSLSDGLFWRTFCAHQRTLNFSDETKKKTFNYYDRDQTIPHIYPFSFKEFCEKSMEVFPVFRKNIDCITETPPCDVFIVYATTENPEIPSENFYHAIEMAMGIVSQKNIPLQTHFGIFRAPSYFLNPDYTMHKKLSLLLHGFAAKVIGPHFYDEQKMWMATVPLDRMKLILEQALGSEKINDYVYANPPPWMNKLMAQVGFDIFKPIMIKLEDLAGLYTTPSL